MLNKRIASAFKSDFKDVKNSGKFSKAIENIFYEVVELLINEQPIPTKYKLHTLIGDYVNCFELHLKPDLLLIFYYEEENTLVLYRIGAHNKLFKNN